MKYIKYGILSVAGFAAVICLGFVLTGVDLAQYGFWAPKYKAVERKVFEESQPYVQGKITYLNRLRGDYELATEEQKPGLRSVIKREAATVKTEYLPSDLRSFIAGL
jgi:hypothetical protein